ncbi:MAG: metallophosphoesterase [Clostridia bacterium]|nr:metallophosphoesterase [Clostridia bacterium]
MEISNYKLNSSKISRDIRIAVVSDAHGCDVNMLKNALEDIKPALIAVPGDIEGKGDKFSRTSYSREFLRMCSSVAPTFVSLGNHDVDITRDLVSECGAVLLDDTYTAARISGADIFIGGLTSGSLGKKHKRLSKTPEPDTGFAAGFAKLGGLKILLSHHPEYYPEHLLQLDIDLIISGHAHGGQWRFFGRGVFAPGQGIFPKYTSGIYDGKLLVSRGAGDHNAIPRFFNPNEICVCDLVALCENL